MRNEVRWQWSRERVKKQAIALDNSFAKVRGWRVAGISICFLIGELRMSEGRRENQRRGEDCVGEVRGGEVKEQDSLPRQRVSPTLRLQIRRKG